MNSAFVPRAVVSPRSSSSSKKYKTEPQRSRPVDVAGSGLHRRIVSHRIETYVNPERRYEVSVRQKNSRRSACGESFSRNRRRVIKFGTIVRNPILLVYSARNGFREGIRLTGPVSSRKKPGIGWGYRSIPTRSLKPDVVSLPSRVTITQVDLLVGAEAALRAPSPAKRDLEQVWLDPKGHSRPPTRSPET